MSLESLPNEVLLQIAQWLALQIEWPYCNARSLSRLARCSKRLGSIATPLIYSTFVSTGSEALPRLLGRVLSRPKVGRRIKEYNMDLSSAEDIDYKRAKKMAYQHVGVDSIAVKDQIVSAVKITGIQHWYDRIRAGDCGAETALLLSLLPNLETINLKINSNLRRSYLDQFLGFVSWLQQNASHGDPFTYLPKLRSFSIAWDKLASNDGSRGLDFRNVIPYMKISSLRSAKIVGYFDNVYFEEPDWEGMRSNVTDLTLEDCVFEGGLLGSFLVGCPSLKKLDFNHGRVTLGAGEKSNPYQPYRLWDAISHLKPCLEELVALNEWKDDSDTLYGRAPFSPLPLKPESTRLGSLAAFERLRILDTNVTVLLGSAGTNSLCLIDVLPQSLVELRLSGCRGGLLAQVCDLLNHRQRFVPVLKKITLTFPIDDAANHPEKLSSSAATAQSGYDEKTARGLEQVCKAASIELCINMEVTEVPMLPHPSY